MATPLPASPLRDRMVFVVGAQRSGTNWLQRMLATHPDVVALPSETHLFSHGIAPLLERFHEGAPTSTRTGVMFADPQRVATALRVLCDVVFGDLAALLDPQASRVVERTPLHAHHLPLIGRIYPDGSVIHIIRDGRDVAASLVAQKWGPTTMADAAQAWATAVRDARAARLSRYREVRYEDLLADPRKQLAGLFDWLNLSVSESVLDAVAEEAVVPYNVDRGNPTVREGKWRQSLSAQDNAAFEKVGGALLRELGYPHVAASAGPPAPGGPTRRWRPPLHPRRIVARIVAVRSRRRTRPATSTHMEEVVAVADRFLTSVGTGAQADLSRLIRPATQVRVVAPDGSRRTARGSRGADLLVEAMAAARTGSGRRVGGESLPHAAGTTLIIAFTDGNRTRHAVLILTVLRDDDGLGLRRVDCYLL